MTKRAPYTCKNCLTVFAPQYPHQAYCSRSCILGYKLTVGGEDDCWLWGGSRTSMGYGQIKINQKLTYVHRLAYELLVGPIGDKILLHSCDTPLCCNPAHLSPGTHLDNARDRSAKGRGAQGERFWNARLVEADIREIRRRCANGEDMNLIAVDYGVTYGHVTKIAKRTKWRHLE